MPKEAILDRLSTAEIPTAATQIGEISPITILRTTPPTTPSTTEFFHPVSTAESSLFPLVRRGNPANPKEITTKDITRLRWYIDHHYQPNQPVNFRDEEFTATTGVSHQQWYMWARIARLDRNIGRTNIKRTGQRPQYHLSAHNVHQILDHIKKLKERGINCLPKAKEARQRMGEKTCWELTKNPYWCRIRPIAIEALPTFCVWETKYIAFFLLANGYCIKTALNPRSGDHCTHRIFAAPKKEAGDIRDFLTTHHKEWFLFLKEAKKSGPDNQSNDEISLGQLWLFLADHQPFFCSSLQEAFLARLHQHFPDLVVRPEKYTNAGQAHTAQMIPAEQAMYIFNSCQENPDLKTVVVGHKTIAVAWENDVPSPVYAKLGDRTLHFTASQTMRKILGRFIKASEYPQRLAAILSDKKQIPYVIDTKGSYCIPKQYEEEFIRRVQQLRIDINRERRRPHHQQPAKLTPELIPA